MSTTGRFFKRAPRAPRKVVVAPRPREGAHRVLHAAVASISAASSFPGGCGAPRGVGQVAKFLAGGRLPDGDGQGRGTKRPEAGSALRATRGYRRLQLDGLRLSSASPQSSGAQTRRNPRRRRCCGLPRLVGSGNARTMREGFQSAGVPVLRGGVAKDQPGVRQRAPVQLRVLTVVVLRRRGEGRVCRSGKRRR